MNRRPERLADLLPAVVADLAARHTTTKGEAMTARIECDLDGLRIYNDRGELVYGPAGWLDLPPQPDAVPRDETKQQSLRQFVEWFREDLVYKAPEVWPGRIEWFLNALVDRYGSAA